MAIIDGSGDPQFRGVLNRPRGKGDSKGNGKVADPGTDAPADTSTVTVPEPLGDPTPEDVKAWYNAQVPYKNIASDQDVANRALNTVKQIKREWENKAVAVRDKWRAIQWMVRGNSMSRMFPESDVHVPELYKKRETMAVRIEEAVLDYDPWFRVKGRERMDRRQEHLLQAFLEWQLDSIRYQDHHGGRIRCMLDYTFCVGKVWMRYEEQSYIKKTTERIEKEGHKSYLRVKRERAVRTILKPMVRMVDPVMFFIDPDAIDPQEAEYVGDSWDATFDEVMGLARLGVYDIEAAESLRGTQGKYETWSDYDRLERSLLFASRTHGHTIDGVPTRVRMSEIWGRFDPYDTGETAEYVITTANDDTVLRVQENPNDSKHRPYAIGRCADEIYEFLGVGPLDHAVRLNIELDEHRNLALKSHRRALAPVVVTPDDTDWADTLWDMDDGKVLRGMDVKVIQTPDTWSNMMQSDGMIKKDIDEITGSPQHHMGTAPSDSTATNTISRSEEGNKRMKSLVRAYTSFNEQVLRILHLLNQQFMVKSQTFRVLGKQGHKLNEYEEIKPQSFDAEVDFEFIGMANLATLGQRASNILTWMQVAAPYSQMYPDRMNMIEALKSSWRYMIGDDPSEDRIFGNIDLSDMVPQREENILLAQGQRVAVHPEDNDDEHLRIIDALVDHPQFASFPPYVQQMFIEHGAEHESQKDKKKLRQQAAGSSIPQLLPPGGPAGSNGTFEGPLGTSQGAPGQTPPNVNPGPPDSGKVAAAGRQGPIPQTLNGGV